MGAAIPGIHHVTCITGDVQKCVDFYVGVLGLRFVKKSINQDLPDTYHIYFGDYLGTPGTAMTFFGWPTWPKQRAGSGQVTTVSFQVPPGSLGFWSNRLKDIGVDHRMVTTFDSDALVLHDPDGIELSLVAQASDDRWQRWPDAPVDEEPVVRTDAFTIDLSVLFFIAILIGGRGSILGPLLGTILLTVLPELAAPQAELDAAESMRPDAHAFPTGDLVLDDLVIDCHLRAIRRHVGPAVAPVANKEP